MFKIYLEILRIKKQFKLNFYEQFITSVIIFISFMK